MTWTSLNAWVAAPEIFLLCATCAILLLDLFISDAKRHITYVLTLLTLAVTAALVLSGHEAQSRLAFSGLFLADPIADFAKLAMIVGVALVLIYGRSYSIARGLFRGELFTLSLFSLLGMMVMASASNFLALYVGLELMSLSVYALVALNRESTQSTEAAMKYFILGALASGMLLYGISMLYGSTGSLDIFEVSKKIQSGEANNLLAVFGIVFVVTGLGFKFGAVPFHMWVPDVYQGAPSPVTTFMSAITKLVAFVALVRIISGGAIDVSESGAAGRIVLTIACIASALFGSIVALRQSNIKRALAYSSISHTAYILLALKAQSN